MCGLWRSVEVVVFQIVSRMDFLEDEGHEQCLTRVLTLFIWIFWLGCTSVASEEKGDTLSTRHNKAFSSVREKLQELRNEVNKMHGEIKYQLGHDNDAVMHLEESLAQATHSANVLSQGIHHTPKPVVGSHAKRHVIREAIGWVLQIIGVYGVLLALGAVSYYCVTGLFMSGGLFMTFLYSLPWLFSSALFFPPLLIMLVVLFDLSYLISSLSIGALIGAVDSFGLIMTHPLWLEKIGLFTLFVGTVSSFIQMNKPTVLRY